MQALGNVEAAALLLCELLQPHFLISLLTNFFIS